MFHGSVHVEIRFRPGAQFIEQRRKRRSNPRGNVHIHLLNDLSTQSLSTHFPFGIVFHVNPIRLAVPGVPASAAGLSRAVTLPDMSRSTFLGIGEPEDGRRDCNT
jgi:hypothetical protein